MTVSRPQAESAMPEIRTGSGENSNQVLSPGQSINMGRGDSRERPATIYGRRGNSIYEKTILLD